LTNASETRFRSFTLGIFAIACSLRLLHLIEIRRAPFFTLLMGDSHAYDAWAQRIAAGDWWRGDVFYQAPLYPYFLALVYRLAGRDLLFVRVIQASIGSISCVLLALAVRRLVGIAAGIAAGLLLAAWAPAIFFDGLIQKSVLDVFLVCVVLYLVSVIAWTDRVDGSRGAVAAWLLLGLALGGLALTRENALVFVVVLLGWALLTRDRIRNAALLCAGVTIVLLPVATRNYTVGGGFYITTSQFGPNFYIGNNAHADGTYASLRYGRGAPEYERTDAKELAGRALGRRLSPAEVSSYWSDQALQFISSRPGAWVKLMARKVALLCNATEMVDTESQETHAEWSWPLAVLGPVTHFGVLVPLALLGIIVTGAARPNARAPARPQLTRASSTRAMPLRLVLVLTIAYAGSVLLFYVFARYRYPLVPLLIVFAAAALVALPQMVRARHLPGGLATALALTAIALFANWPIVPTAWMRAVSETNIAVALQSDRRFDEALDHYRRAVSFRPDYAPAMNNMATALRASGLLDEAIATYRRALSVQPDFPDAEYNFANALLDAGATDEAITRFQSALHSLPASADAHNNLGMALAAANRPDEALAEFQQVLQLEPDSAVAHRNIGDLLAAKGDRAGALMHLQRAVQSDPSSGEAYYDLGSVWLDAGAFEKAEQAFRAATERMPSSAEARNNLGIALGSQGRFDEAINAFRDALRVQPAFADARKNLATAEAARRAARRPS
jgi:tetratricopeptide (TPR) repeat protein